MAPLFDWGCGVEVQDYLAWAASFIETMGLRGYILALAIVAVSVSLLKRLMDR